MAALASLGAILALAWSVDIPLRGSAGQSGGAQNGEADVLSSAGASSAGADSGEGASHLFGNRQRSLEIRVARADGVTVGSAWLFLPNEPMGQRWRRWTPERSIVALTTGVQRVRAFSAELRDSNPNHAAEGMPVAPALTAPMASPWMTLDGGELKVTLDLRPRRGILGHVQEPGGAGWLRYASAFAHGPTDSRVLEPGERFRGGVERSPLVYGNSAAYIEWADLPAGRYLVGLRYPDHVVRECEVVEVTSGLVHVPLAIHPPEPQRSLIVDPRDELGGQLGDVTYRVEHLAAGAQSEDSSGVDSLHFVVAADGSGHLLDLRGVPAAQLSSGGAEGETPSVWLHATSTSRGERRVPLSMGLLQRGSPLGIDFSQGDSEGSLPNPQ